MDLSSSCLERDFDSQNCMQVLQVAMILAKYGKLNRELTSRIFSVEFLDKIDDEIEKCPSERNTLGRVSTYPKNLRRAMMNLNRRVCICYPEYKVPWFHEKYCIEEANFLRGIGFNDSQMEPIREDIYQTLCSVVGGPRNVRENVFAPYYHFIHFEVWLDMNDVSANSIDNMVNASNFIPIGK